MRTLEPNYIETEAKRISKRLLSLAMQGKCIGNDTEYANLSTEYRDLDKIYKVITGRHLSKYHKPFRL